MDLERWDREIAPHLASIRLDAGWLMHYVKKIVDACGQLAAKPGFETEAQDAIMRSIAALELALIGLRKAKDIYDGKPNE
jgi:hypothetical protein